MFYPIAIIQQGGKYHGRFPDLPELEITALDMANIISNARTEVINHLQTLTLSDKPLPEGSDVSSHLANPEYAGWTWAIVNIDSARIIGEAVELHITIPERLMQKVDSHMQKNGVDIDTFFIELIKEKL